MKGTSAKGKEIPKSLDYFNIQPFPELVAVYGQKPDKLIVMFPTDNIEDFFFTEYNLWASKGGSAIKRRKCDGEECVHLIEEEFGGVHYKAGEISQCLCLTSDVPEKDKCRSYTSIKAFILHPSNGVIISPMCYFFETHSDNSSDNVYTELEKTFMMTGGRIARIPFVLSVKMVERGGKEKHKFPIWNIQPAITETTAMLNYANRLSLPTTKETAIRIEDLEISEPKALNEVNPEVDNGGPLFGEDASPEEPIKSPSKPSSPKQKKNLAPELDSLRKEAFEELNYCDTLKRWSEIMNDKKYAPLKKDRYFLKRAHYIRDNIESTKDDPQSLF